MVQGSLGRGQGKGLGRLGRVQAGPRAAQGGHREGLWPREGMRRGENEEEEKREGMWGFEFLFSFGPKGREGGFRNPLLLLLTTWEEGVSNSPPFLARRGREEASISSLLLATMERKRGRPCFWFAGGRGSIQYSNPFNDLWKRGGLSTSL